MKFSTEQLAAAARRRAERKPERAAERISEAAQDRPIVTYFDWEIPELTAPHLNTFLALVRYQAGERSFRIPIDVARLAAEGRTADLEKLLAILSARQAGLDGRHSLVGPSNGCWLSALEQTEPELSLAERQVKVRQLLLFESGRCGES